MSTRSINHSRRPRKQTAPTPIDPVAARWATRAPGDPEPDAPCPQCGAAVNYTSVEQFVFCKSCGWQRLLTDEQNHDFLWALLGLSDLRPGLLLQAVVAEGGGDEPPPDGDPAARPLLYLDTVLARRALVDLPGPYVVRKVA